MRVLVTTSIAILSSIVIVFGGYKYGDYQKHVGIKEGIMAVIDVCAEKGRDIFLDEEKGVGMACMGGAIPEGMKTPGKGVSEAPSPTPEPQAPHNLPPGPKDQADPSMT